MARVTIHIPEIFKDEKPIIPSGDKCCVGVCVAINETIPHLEDLANQCIMAYKEYDVARRKGYKGEVCNRLLRRSKMLKDLRLTFKERGICRCVE